MRKIQLLFLVVPLLFATGCPKYRPKVDFNNPDGLVAKVNKRFADWQTQYHAAVARRDFDRAKTIRNDLLAEAIPYLDEAYMDFITGLQSGRDRGNFILDLVELGTAGAIGITNGERPIQIMGVALTAFRGGRRSADLNFYKEQSTPILINKMDGNRAKVRAVILTREKEPVDVYSIGGAISDLVDYYNAGTLVRAFTELSKDTAAQTKEAEDTVLQLKGVPITGEATEAQRDVSVQAKQILDSLREDLKDPATAPAAVTRLQNIIKTLEADPALAQMLTDANIASSETDGVKIRGALIAMRRNASLKGETVKLDKINQAIVDNGQ